MSTGPNAIAGAAHSSAKAARRPASISNVRWSAPLVRAAPRRRRNSGSGSGDRCDRLIARARASRVARMRPFALHVMTGGATLLILALLALPAKRALERPSDTPGGSDRSVRRCAVRAGDGIRGASSACTSIPGTSTTGRPRSARRRRRSRSSRRSPAIAASAATPRRAARKGIRRLMLSWEPWTPVASSLGVGAQSAPQPGYRNVDIARGAQDRYITRDRARARGVPRHGLPALRARDERLLVSVEPRRRAPTAGHGAASSGCSTPPERATCASSGRSTRTSTSPRTCGARRCAGTGRGAGTSTSSARR